MKIQSYSFSETEDNLSNEIYLDRYGLEESELSSGNSQDAGDFYFDPIEENSETPNREILFKHAQELKHNVLNSSEEDLRSREELLAELDKIFRILGSDTQLPALWEGLDTKLADLESRFIDDLLNSDSEAQPALAGDLALRLGLDVEEVTDLASRHQVNLENISSTPHDSVIRFILAARDDLGELVSGLEQAVTDKQSRDDAMVMRANLRNTTAQLSNHDVDDMNFAPFEYLWKAQRSEDEGSREIQGKLEQLTESINSALIDLGENFQYQPGEMSDLLGIDFPSAPELVPIAIDARGRGRYENYAPPTFFELIGEGYPYYSYQGTLNS